MVCNNRAKFRPFQEAREFVRSQKLKNRREWDRYRKPGKLPRDIPQNSSKMYTAEWKSLDDWLGIELQEMKFKPFVKARDFVRSLKLKNDVEWKQYCESGSFLDDIPKNPKKTYKKEWKGIGDWIGTNVMAHQKKIFRNYEEARAFVH